MIAALYARKSNLQPGLAQEATSVQRQIQHGRAFAESKGWVVDPAYIFSDDGISGAEFEKRPGLARLLNALPKKGQPPTFQILVVSEISRLGREQRETGYVLHQLAKAGVRVFTYLTGQEAKAETAIDKVVLQLGMFADEMERERAKQRSTDGRKQRARGGYAIGNKVFGYTNKRGSHGFVELVINEPEAKVVRRIFDLYVGHGWSPTRIARHLNAEHAPAPATSGVPKREWDPELPREQRPTSPCWSSGPVGRVLYRDIYRGRRVTHWGDEDICVPAEHLRLVSDALFEKAQARLLETKRIFLRRANGTLNGKPAGLAGISALSGILQCGLCGSPMVARQTRKRVPVFQCRGYVVGHSLGKPPCRNGVRLGLKEAERAILQAIETRVLTPEVIAGTLKKAAKKLVATIDTEERASLQAALRRVEGELAHLVKAVASGGQWASLVSAVEKAELTKGQILERLAAMEQAERLTHLNVKSLEPALRQRLAEWSGLMSRHPAQTRQILRKLHPVRLRLTPDFQTKTFTFAGDAHVGGLLQGLIPAMDLTPATYQ